MRAKESLIMAGIFGAALAVHSCSAKAEQYAFADYGRASLAVTSQYISEARLSSPVSSVGVGHAFGNGLAIEFAFHDFGTYRAVGSKDFHFGTDLKIGPFTFPLHASINVPGYVEVRAYGESLGVKYQSSYGLFAKATVAHVTAEGELHTPVGYSMETRRGFLPMGEIGVKFGKVKATYLAAPKMSAISLGVQLDF